MAAETASGIGCNFMVAFVIIPNVPSDPMNKSVKLYPADDFLGPMDYKKNMLQMLGMKKEYKDVSL